MSRFVQFVVLGAVVLTAVGVFADVPHRQSAQAGALIEATGKTTE